MLSRRARASSWIAVVVALLATVPAPAVAQTGALDRFDPSPAGDVFVSLPSADVSGKLRVSVAASVSYAHDPLVLRQLSGGTPLQWVRDQAILHAQVGVEVWRRVKL